MRKKERIQSDNDLVLDKTPNSTICLDLNIQKKSTKECP